MQRPPDSRPGLRDIGSFNLGVSGQGNSVGNNVGAEEKAAPGLTLVAGVLASQAPQDALGRDYNGDGKGNGFNVPSLLGIHALPPYLHNGACETLACVVSRVDRRRFRALRLRFPPDRGRLMNDGGGAACASPASFRDRGQGAQ